MKYSNLIIKVLLVVLVLSLGVTSGIAKAPSDYKMVLILPGPINDPVSYTHLTLPTTPYV